MNCESKTLECYGREIKFEVKPGTMIMVDGWKHATYLNECEVPEVAAIRIKSPTIEGVAPAANIRITGRTLQRRSYHYSFFIKVQIEFVSGDETPNTIHSGWLMQQ